MGKSAKLTRYGAHTVLKRLKRGVLNANEGRRNARNFVKEQRRKNNAAKLLEMAKTESTLKPKIADETT